MAMADAANIFRIKRQLEKQKAVSTHSKVDFWSLLLLSFSNLFGCEIIIFVVQIGIEFEINY